MQCPLTKNLPSFNSTKFIPKQAEIHANIQLFRSIGMNSLRKKLSMIAIIASLSISGSVSVYAMEQEDESYSSEFEVKTTPTRRCKIEYKGLRVTPTNTNDNIYYINMAAFYKDIEDFAIENKNQKKQIEKQNKKLEKQNKKQTEALERKGMKRQKPVVNYKEKNSGEGDWI